MASLEGRLPNAPSAEERVRIVCSGCQRLVGKVFESEWRVWLNCFRKPRPVGTYRGTQEHIEAPAVVVSKLLKGPSDQNVSMWCDRCHVERSAELAGLYAKVDSARHSKRAIRHAAT